MSGTQNPMATNESWAQFDLPSGSKAASTDEWAAFDAPKPQQSALRQIARGFGLGTRDVLEGAASLPGLAYDVAALPLNAGIAGYNALTGGKAAYIPSGSKQFGGILDAVGLPKAESTGKKFNSGLIQDATSVLTGVGAAGAASSAMTGVRQAVARVLASQPAMQVASGAIGGGVAEATDSPVAGLIAGALTPVGVAGARRIITPVPNVNLPGRKALVDAAEREGIPLTAGQATGSPFLKNVEAVLEQMPFTSAAQRAIGDNQRTKFIEAAWRKAGETASDTLPDTIISARNRIGGRIGQIADRNNMNFTPQLDADLAEISANLRFMPSEVAGPVGARIDQLRGMTIGKFAPGMPDPIIPGPSYRMLDSQIGKSIRQTSDGDRRTALIAIREKLRTAMDASISPSDKTEWDKMRRQYANMSVIADAAGQAGASAAEGVMSPVALRGALAKSIGKGGYELGRGDMNDLARIGQSLLRAPADSGTAGRSFAHNILTGSLGLGGAGMGAAAGGPIGAMVGAAGSVAIPRVAQMMMNSGPGQAYLRNQISANPTMTANLARALALHGAMQNNNQKGP